MEEVVITQKDLDKIVQYVKMLSNVWIKSKRELEKSNIFIEDMLLGSMVMELATQYIFKKGETPRRDVV